MPLTGLTGSRVRARRLQMGLRQSDLARTAGISGSYLNLIEHDRRRIRPEVLARLAAALGVDAAVLAEGVEAARIEDLHAAAAAAAASAPAGSGGVDGGARPELDRIEDFLNRFPGWADLLAGQHRRLGQLERVVAALNDRISHDPHLSSALHEVLSAISSVRSTAAILAETEDIAPEWRARFHGNLHADSERLAAGAEALVAYLDGSDQAEDQGSAAPQEEVEGWLGRHGWHLAALEAGDTGALEAEIAALASGAARALARAWLAQARADVAVLPLVPFMVALNEMGPDPVLLARRFGAGVLAVFRRLATLPDAPEGLVICDASGTLLIAKPIEGFALPRFGAACPLWPLYTALSRPMVPVEALAEVPGLVGQRYHIRAFCEPGFPEGFGGMEVRTAAMLIAPAQSGAAAGAAVGLLLGSSCRICPRAGCAARREPSIMAEFS